MHTVYDSFLKIKSKKISCVELTQECIKKAEQSSNNTFISLTKELALEQAQKIDQSGDKNSLPSFLQGIPYTLKDLFVTKNIRTTGGSKILYNYIPPYEGYVSAQLQSAGGVLIGKVNCDEFGMGSTNEYSAFGAVKNPLDTNYVAGGSSGGSAASVAEGSSLYSIGTDTGGSIRLPANFCGLTGFKPSYGRVSRYGQLAFASSLDQSSPLARNTLDIGCVMENITQHDQRDATHAPLDKMNIVSDLLSLPPQFLQGKKLGWCPEFVSSCTPQIQKSLKEALEKFKKQGVELLEFEFPHFKYAVEVYYIVATSEASTNLARYDGIRFGLSQRSGENLADIYVRSRSEGFGDEVKRRILIGTFSLSSGYHDAYFNTACKVRRLIYQDFQKAFAQCDMIFAPVCTSTAMKRGEAIKDTVKIYMNDIFTIPVNLAGLPALALPYGQGENNLPTGFQLIGKQFTDEDVLKWGQAFEKFC